MRSLQELVLHSKSATSLQMPRGNDGSLETWIPSKDNEDGNPVCGGAEVAEALVAWWNTEESYQEKRLLMFASRLKFKDAITPFVIRSSSSPEDHVRIFEP